MEKKPPLLILTGPTAVGKTKLSVALAKEVGGEIISADSMQVYRYMDIGSAKIRPEEMQGVPHHMIDIINPWEPFNIVLFQQYARACIRDIYSRGHIPILTGGTGFYIQSVLYEITFAREEGDMTYRAQLEALCREKGEDCLHAMLRACDPVSAKSIHPHNHKRLIRALEYYHQTGEPISGHNAQMRARESAYNACYFVLTDDRARLYERIERRVDEMMEAGLVEEVRRLQTMGCVPEMVSMQGLGYQEILQYLNGELSLERAVYLIKRDTRHFAKRQLTWFRREKDVIWLEQGDFGYDSSRILTHMSKIMREKGMKGEL